MILCVLLKKSLYCGKMFCMYLVDLVAVSLVSCMVMAVGGFWEYVITSCRHGIAVLSDVAFHVVMYVSWLVSNVGLGGGIWLCIIGGLGCVYSMMGFVHLNACVSSC